MMIVMMTTMTSTVMIGTHMGSGLLTSELLKSAHLLDI